jgi:hypothetical protein
MSDTDQLTDSAELQELRDALSRMEVPGAPRLELITARGRARRQQRVSRAARLSVGVVVAGTALAVGLTVAHGPAAKLGTIRTAAYTLRHNQNGTDTLTLNPGELLNPAQLQSDLARYGIPAMVTSGSYCTSDPAPAGFPQVVTGPGGGTWQAGSGTQPTMTIDPSHMPSGTELSVGEFQITSGQFAGEQQADMDLISSSSYSCTSAPPTLGPDTPGFGLLYGGHGRGLSHS